KRGGGAGAARALAAGAIDVLALDDLHDDLLVATVDRAIDRHHAEEQFRVALAAAPAGVLVADDTGAITLANPAAEKLFGAAPGGLLWRRVDEFLPGRRDPDGDEVAVRCDGDERPVSVTRSTVDTVRARLALYWITDLAERRALERQMVAAQRMESVGRLAGGVAHDFNNVLTVIQSYGAFLRNSLPADSQQQADVAEILGAAERAARLTSQLLAFSRRQLLDPRVANLNDVVVAVSSLLRRLIGEDVDLVTSLAEDLGAVSVDVSQLDQVLINLAVNARDAMPDGGTITIETSNVTLGSDYGSRKPVAVPPGDYVLLAVTDTGTGIAPDIRDRIFEPFFSTKDRERGTGLGLATVYGIVKQSGGFIWVYSEVGVGTTFKIYLPRVASKPAAAGRETPAPQRETGEETVLLIEDDDAVRRATVRLLRAGGYRVLQAADGDEAVRVADGHDGRIHALLTDVIVPGRSVRDVADELRRRDRRLRVLYMSGYTENTIAHRGLLDDGIAFIQKPFSGGALLRKLREVLDAGE
ncbi:MAG: response regulator, partial [Deltaproteobacteria bacterium]